MQVFQRTIPVRHIKFGQVVFSKLKFDLAAFRDFDGVLQRLGMLRKERCHLVRILDVELLCLKLHARRVVDRLAHLDGHQDILNARILAGQVVRVVGGHQSEIEFACQLVQAAVDFLLHRDTMILHFQIEVVTVKNFKELLAQLIRTVDIALSQRTRNRTRQTGRQADQPLAMLPQQIHINARLHIKAFGKTERDHMNQVAVACHVFAQQDQMAVPFTVHITAVKARMRRDINLTPDDRMDALGLAGAVKVNHAVHHAVVGQCAGCLAERGHAVDQTLNAARAVEQAVFAVHMQMGKCCHLVLL